MKPQGGKLVAFSVGRLRRGPQVPARPAARRKKQATMAWCLMLLCAVGTDHQQHTDALSKQLVHHERLCAMQQAQLQQLKRKCECLGRELAQAKEAWAESCPGERHGRRYFSPRQGLALAARAVATNSAVTQLGVQMGTQIHRSTIADWKVRLHVAIQAFNHKLFAELSSCMGAEMLPIDDGAPEPTCAFAVHIIHRKSGRYEIAAFGVVQSFS